MQAWPLISSSRGAGSSRVQGQAWGRQQGSGLGMGQAVAGRRARHCPKTIIKLKITRTEPYGRSILKPYAYTRSMTWHLKPYARSMQAR